jgi:uncharacterized membrane protein
MRVVKSHSDLSTLTMRNSPSDFFVPPPVKARRIESIDLLRGTVMIIMALDHVRHFFHHDAYLFEPTDLTQTTPILFFTRWITHFCAPVFVFLAGISAYLYGVKKSRKELANYLFTRGIWLVFAELFIIGFGQTFNPSFSFFNLQVIWAIGIGMIALSGIIYMKRPIILAIVILLLAGHNFLDSVHLPGHGIGTFAWSVLHESSRFSFGRFNILVLYPVIPWIGILTLGYYLGFLFSSHCDAEKRKMVLLVLGFIATELFLLLRTLNMYGDAAHWINQKNAIFSMLSYMNVTKYPPSLLYILMTLGPAMIFLALAEKPLNSFTKKVAVFGRVPFFYYVVHIYLLHLFAMFGAVLSGYHWSDMVLTTRINLEPGLKGFGFNLSSVYLIWIGLILILYPVCKWYDQYKRAHLSTSWWLTYL